MRDGTLSHANKADIASGDGGSVRSQKIEYRSVFAHQDRQVLSDVVVTKHWRQLSHPTTFC
jgi:hypothetical protein